jgi:hypothetical protein
MRKRNALVMLLFGVFAACGAMSSKPEPPPLPVDTPTPLPTVPPAATPLPGASATPVPLPTRPLENPDAAKAKEQGKAIGPVVTFAGLARADGKVIEPTATENGVPVFTNYVGSGFILLVEGKPGISNLEVGRKIFGYDPDDPKKRPDLEVQVTRPLGDGSAAVCDSRRPNIGGIPAINPPNFADTATSAATLNDMSCRFETFIEPLSACTLDVRGDFAFARPDTKTQFCMVVARAWAFQVGDTLVSVRLRDAKGNPGPVSKFVLRRPKDRPKSTIVRPTPKPTPSRRRP